jgi:lipid II:glycine glycyltransferase (peptidoglycan interpeptide bridge formation enzyme)
VALTLRAISADDHLAWIDKQASVSFLQTPAWAQVKTEWRAESLGWFDGDTQVGAALVLHRPMPKIPKTLAYLPEGPTIDWGLGARQILDPLVAHLKSGGAFAIRIGPPEVARRWGAETLKEALADDSLGRLIDVKPDTENPDAIGLAGELRVLGWRPVSDGEDGFAAGQPKYNFWLPLAGRTADQVFAGMNQLWRRNIRKAEKLGVTVSRGTREDLADFHRVYVETAKRDQFTARPLGYFTQMWDALTAEHAERFALYLAHHEGDLVAATTMVQVGTHAWYSYGASTTQKRDVRGSNAIQWRMICDAIDRGAEVYDLRGITDTLDAADPHVGLIRFKVGTGGEAIEYVGEWDLPINRLLYRGFTEYLKRR